MINMVVTDGKVHFWGFVESDEQRGAMRVAAENIPGVVAREGPYDTRCACPELRRLTSIVHLVSPLERGSSVR